MSPHRSDPGELRFGAGPLFDRTARQLTARKDPPTSRRAAEGTVQQLSGMQRFALQAVRDYPGHTTKEMARHLFNAEHGGLLRAADAEEIRQQIGRRLNELEAAGLVYRKGTRDGCAIWWPSKSEEV